MENLFIKNSKFDIDKLKENKEFLHSLIGQIQSAFIVRHHREYTRQDSMEIEIGTREHVYHKFEVDAKGVISFRSHSFRILNKEAERLLKKYPNSSVQWVKSANCYVDGTGIYGFNKLAETPHSPNSPYEKDLYTEERVNSSVYKVRQLKKKFQYAYVTLNINSITKKNIENIVKDIVIALEGSGDASLCLRR